MALRDVRVPDSMSPDPEPLVDTRLNRTSQFRVRI